MESAAALAMCADLRLSCADDVLPASKYVMVHASPLVARLVEDLVLEKVDGTETVPFPGVTAAFLRPAVDWLHGTRDPASSDIADVVRVLDALDFLGIGTAATDRSSVATLAGTDRLLARLWDLVRHESLEVFVTHLPRLVHTSHASGALELLTRMVPMWADARPLVRALGITPSVSPTATRILARHFPANLVFHEILDVLQDDPAATCDDFLKLLGSSGTHYLPDEMPFVFGHLATALSSRDASEALVDFLRNSKLALETYDVVPHVPRNGVQGSAIAFHHTPLCTLLADVSDLPRTRVARRKLAPWLRVELDYAQACASADVRVAVIDDPLAKTATCFEIRVMVIDPRTRACAETWHSFEHVSPQDWVALSGANAVRGDRAAFRRAFASPSFSHLRFDVFFGALSPLRDAAPPEDVAKAVALATSPPA